MFQAVLWDLDGTIIDSALLHFQAWREMLQRYGVDYSYGDFMHGFGRNNRSVLTELFGEDLPPETVLLRSDEKEHAYRRLVDSQGVTLLPGVEKWLSLFAADDAVQVISSSGPMANIAATVAAVGIGDYFHSLMSGAPLSRGKPHPDLFLNSAAAAAVEPSACLVIEDSVHGIEAARRAGMHSIAVGDLAHSQELPGLLTQHAGPPCLAVPNLADLTWTELAAAMDGG